MKTVARFQMPEQAHLFRSFLASKEIPGWIFDEYTVEVAWFYSNAIGGVRVMVNDADGERAVNCFSEYSAALREGEQMDTSARCWPVALVASLIVGLPFLLFGRKNPYAEVSE